MSVVLQVRASLSVFFFFEMFYKFFMNILKVIQELMVLQGKHVTLVLQDFKVPKVTLNPRVKREQWEKLVQAKPLG